SRYSYTTSWPVGRRFCSDRRVALTSRSCAGENLSISVRTWASADRRSAADWVLAGASTSTGAERRFAGAFFAITLAPVGFATPCDPTGERAGAAPLRGSVVTRRSRPDSRRRWLAC